MQWNGPNPSIFFPLVDRLPCPASALAFLPPAKVSTRSKKPWPSTPKNLGLFESTTVGLLLFIFGVAFRHLSLFYRRKKKKRIHRHREDRKKQNARQAFFVSAFFPHTRTCATLFFLSFIAIFLQGPSYFSSLSYPSVSHSFILVHSAS
ncbi:hypothetical protein F5H01DRAFT_342438 [Linnemannia elongata]|nr:hypothetical protein F5H01DRAFT_342438 [Linnemannia elongata]